MDTEKQIIQNYGILASISWNSKKWADNPTTEDLKASKYDYVKDNAHMHESLNFGHYKFPSEKDGLYIGYTPMFNRVPDTKNSKNVNIVFFISSDYKNSNRKTIVGFYGFPKFGNQFKKTAKHDFYKLYNNGNIKAYPKDIIYFDNQIVINNDSVQKNNFFPVGKKISQQGFNYLHSDNVYNLIVLALKLNPQNIVLQKFVNRFPFLIELTKETNDFKDFAEIIENTNANSVMGINELENKMKKQSPEIKQKISSFIERGTMANKIKIITKYKCLVCEALKHNPYSFKKSNGEYYVEAHHVEPVSTMKKGVLSIRNLVTVCANHHRQLHYGNAIVVEQSDNYFKFEIDGKTVEIKKININ